MCAAASFSWEFVESALESHTASRCAMSGPRPSIDISAITTDSRHVTPGGLFVAIAGESYDGHAFIPSALEKGASAILCRHGTQIPSALRERVRVFEVLDTQDAYRALAAAWRRCWPSIPVIIVAGSVGKTTTKDLLAAMLEGSAPGRVLKTTASQNGFVGIPMTLLDVRPEHHRFAVIEVGIDEPCAMQQHTRIIKATHAVLTAIDPEHLEKLVDLPTVAREEGFALLDTVALGGRAMINLDDEWIAPLAHTLPYSQVRTYSLGKISAHISGHLSHDETLQVRTSEGATFDLSCPLPGEHHARNLLAAVTIALDLGLTAEEIKRGLSTFKGAPGRTEIRRLSSGARVIADHYNANPSSMLAAFDILTSISVVAGGRRLACLGDMLELGLDEEQWHRTLATPLIKACPAVVFLYGPRSHWLEDELLKLGFSGKLLHFESQELLIAEIKALIQPPDVLLLKGSRGMKMEAILDAL